MTVDEQYDQGIALKDAGKLEEAIALWEKIASDNPDHAITHSALACNLHRLGRFDDAIKHALRVAEIEPTDAFSYTQLSVVYQRCGKIPEAEDAKEKAHMMRGGHHHH